MPAQLSLRFHAAATTAPATPTPAASVGVAQPMYSEPRTLKATSPGRISSLSRASFSLSGIAWSSADAGGASSGCSLQRTMM